METEGNLMVIHPARHQYKKIVSDGIEKVPDEKISFVRKMISAGVFRFAGWWSIFAGLLALNSVCPICGSAACPVGIGTTGIIAAFFAGVKQWGARLFEILSARICNICGRK